MQATIPPQQDRELAIVKKRRKKPRVVVSFTLTANGLQIHRKKPLINLEAMDGTDSKATDLEDIILNEEEEEKEEEEEEEEEEKDVPTNLEEVEAIISLEEETNQPTDLEEKEADNLEENVDNLVEGKAIKGVSKPPKRRKMVILSGNSFMKHIGVSIKIIYMFFVFVVCFR